MLLWDLTDRDAPAASASPHRHSSGVTAMAFSPDGRTLATGSDDKTVLLWDLTDRGAPDRAGQPLTGHTSVVTSMAFSPDGRTLVAGGADGTTAALGPDR